MVLGLDFALSSVPLNKFKKIKIYIILVILLVSLKKKV